MNKSKGLVTIPTDVDVVSGTLELMERWGADALRDCDGTDFPQELRDVDAKSIPPTTPREKITTGQDKILTRSSRCI